MPDPTAQDEQFMREALAMAREALAMAEVPIGCVIVDAEDRIVARGRNRTNETRNATCHAEFDAIARLDASQRNCASLRLYVTVEPCIMCAAALRRLRLCRVYFGCYNERFGGCGSIIPVHCDFIPDEVDPPLQITLVGQFRKACVELLRHFYLCENGRAPVPRNKGKRRFKPVEADKEGPD